MGSIENFDKNVNRDINQFGLYQSELDEIDLADGKKDNQYRGESLFDVLSRYKVSYNKTKNTCTFFEFIKSKNKLDKINNPNPPAEVAQDIIDEIFKFGVAKLDKPISRINANNVVEVIRIYKEKSDEKNTVKGKLIDDESIFEAILDESISDEKKKKYINHIKDKLVERVYKQGGRAEYLGNVFSKAVDAALEKWWPMQSSEKLDQLFNSFLNILDNLQVMNERADVKKSTIDTNWQMLYNICKKLGLNTQDLPGNGHIADGDSIQATGNCLLHARINSLLAIEKGIDYLDNLIVKNKIQGTIAVKLPGAAKMGLPKPTGDGIYVYSIDELANRALETSIGSGDYTALICAIEDARKEASGNQNATSVASSCDISMDELLFAKESTKLIYQSKNDAKLGFRLAVAKREYDKAVKSKDNNLIETSRQRYFNLKKVEQSRCADYSEVKSKFDSGNIALSTGVNKNQIIKGMRNGREITLLDKHAYAVVKMDKNMVTLKESNNPKSLITISKEEFLKMSCYYIELFDNNGQVVTDDLNSES